MTDRTSRIDPAIVKSYDIRGIYGEQFDASFAYRLGRALPVVVPAHGAVVGHDARLGSPELATALAAGFRDEGLGVTYLGMCPTECVYFQNGCDDSVGLGVMVTASHNPPEYNGFKVTDGDVAPVTGDSGLGEAVERAMQIGDPHDGDYSPLEAGSDVLGPFLDDMLARVGAVNADGLRVVVDASNGVGGVLWRHLEPRLGIEPVMLNGEPDGRFPGHNPDPTKAENLEPLVETVMGSSADMGLIYDGDADRVVAVLGDGTVLGGSQTVACLMPCVERGENERVGLGMTVSRSTWDFCRARGVEPVMLPVGHSKIKRILRADGDIVLAGESAGHYYFRDFHFSDSAVLTTLHLLRMAAAGELGSTVGALPGQWAAPASMPVLKADEREAALRRARDLIGRVLDRMPDYREICCEKDARMERDCGPADIDDADGVRVDYEDWWFAVRPSGTEPIVRITLEADGRARLEDLLDELPEEFSA